MVQLTSKQRAFLKSLAMKEDAILQLGKTGVTPEFTASLDEALAARELVKIGVQKTFAEDEDLQDVLQYYKAGRKTHDKEKNRYYGRYV